MMQPIDIAIEYSHSNNSRVRSNAAVALAALDDAIAVERLGQMAREDPDRGVRRTAINRLAHLEGDPGAAQSLLAAMTAERDDEIRIDLVRLLAAARERPPEVDAELKRMATEDHSADVRWTAIQALNQSDRNGAPSWTALLTAASEDQDPDVRARSGALLAERVAKSQATLDAAALNDSQYRQIGDLKRTGLQLPPIKGSALRRLRLAWGARRNPNIRVPFVKTRARALLIATLMPFAVVMLVVILAKATVSGDQMAIFIFTAMGAAALAACTIPFLWRPIATVPDRVAGAACELGWAGLRLLAGSFMAATLVLMTANQFNFTRALLTSSLITIVVVGIRWASILAYRQRPKPQGAGGSLQTIAATLAGWSILLVITVALALAKGGTDLWASLFFALMPAIAAIAVVSARIDASLPDLAVYRAVPVRTIALGVLCLPVFVGLGLTIKGQGASPFVHELKLGTTNQYSEPFEGEFDVQVGATPGFELEFAQPVTFQAYQRQLGDDFTLRILRSDRTPVAGAPPSVNGILGPVYLQKGAYYLSISQAGDSTAAPTPLGWPELPFEQAALRTAGALARGSGRRSSADSTNGVRVSAKWNGRRARYGEVQAAESFRLLLINLQKADASAAPGISYAVLHEDEGPFSAGAIVRSVKETVRNSESKTMWQLVYGGTNGPSRAELKRQSTVQLTGRPDRGMFVEAAAYRKIFSAREDGVFDGALARELRRMREDGATVALLEQAGRWADSANGRLFQGRYFIYTGGPENVPIQTGSIVRGIRWEAQEEAGFELIEGAGVSTTASNLYYWLAKGDTVLLDSPAWPPADDEASRDLRREYALQDKPVTRANYISRGDKNPPTLARAVPTSMFQGLLSVRKVTRDVGRWIDDFKVDLGSRHPPDVFGHYFMLARHEGEFGRWVGLGSIVVGETWDNDGAPRMRVVYGWTLGQDSYYLTARNLTYLGPTLTSEAVRVAGHLRPPNFGRLVDTRATATPR
jgi:hypothetical protein